MNHLFLANVELDRGVYFVLRLAFYVLLFLRIFHLLDRELLEKYENNEKLELRVCFFLNKQILTVFVYMKRR